ncbi:unnamed protein product [Blepharisma stoltei]|uniref:Uncharacterized protein n=1 Tax=Blepharisma stoltei TaxID=1481888 RepID=A0AAU9J3H8_9CILI|nr:unnamed protein product [Blepharisma stoltei]
MLNKGNAQTPVKAANMVSKTNSQRNSPAPDHYNDKRHIYNKSVSPGRFDYSSFEIPYKRYKEKTKKQKIILDISNEDARMKEIFTTESKFSALASHIITPKKQTNNISLDNKPFNRRKTDLMIQTNNYNGDAERKRATAAFFGDETDGIHKISNQLIIRFAKNQLKSMIHDPITGEVKEFRADREKLLPLGEHRQENVATKICESPPPSIRYELPKFGKKVPRNTIFNPLTGEIKEVDKMQNLSSDGMNKSMIPSFDWPSVKSNIIY